MKSPVLNRLVLRLKGIQRFERALAEVLVAGYRLYEFIHWLLSGWLR